MPATRRHAGSFEKQMFGRSPLLRAAAASRRRAAVMGRARTVAMLRAAHCGNARSTCCPCTMIGYSLASRLTFAMDTAWLGGGVGGNAGDDSRTRKDAIGRKLKHDRYYGTPEPKDKKDKVGIAKRFKDVDPIRKTKSPTKFAKAAAGTLRDLERTVAKVRDLAPQTQKGFNFKKIR